MEIKTKFNVGDTIYVIGVTLFKGLKVFNHEITEIITESRYIPAIKRVRSSISYSTNHNNVGIPEESIFETLEEAQAECNKRNKEK